MALAHSKLTVTVKNDKVDRFTAQPKMPAADQCPILGSPSGAFLEWQAGGATPAAGSAA